MLNLPKLFLLLGFNENYFNTLASVTLFKKRIRILKPFDYLSGLFENANKAIVSYNTLAASIGQVYQKTVSKQALHQVMNTSSFLLFIQTIFNDLLLAKIGIFKGKDASRFNKIIIQDSTIIKLPSSLFSLFSGVKNQYTQVTNARIQFSFNLKTHQIEMYELNTYSEQDVAVCHKLVVKENDLVIRDRGYHTYAELTRIQNEKAFFISRFKHISLIFDHKTGKQIDLLKVLKKSKNEQEIIVNLSSPTGPLVRLITQKVNDEIANTRRQKFKQEQKRNTPKQKTLDLMSWTIYITNIMDSDFNFKEINNYYLLRWRVEIIFKAMKSHLNLDSIHKVSENQLKFILLAKMINIILIIQIIYKPISIQISNKYQKDVSLLKLFN